MTAPELRRLAEAKLQERRQKTAPLHTADPDTLRLVHELEVHQIELEMQQEELIRSGVELEAALDQYTDLYDFAPVGYFTLTRDGQIKKTNLLGAKLLGVERGKLIEKHFGKYVAFDSRPLFSTFLEKLFSNGGNPETCELALQNKESAPLWIQIEGSRADLQSPVCRAVVVDITERKRAEQALQHSEAQISGILASTTDAILTMDEDQNIILFNRAAEQMFQCPANEAIGSTLDRFLPEFVRKEHREHVRGFGHSQTTRRSMASPALELTCLRSDGEAFASEVSISLVEVDGKKLYTAVIRDITERKQAEQALAVSQKFLQDVLDNSTALIYVLDLESRFSLVNRRLESVFGVPRDSLIGQPRSAILPPEIAAEHRAHDLEVIDSQLSMTVEERHQEPDGEHVYLSTKFPIFGLRGEVYAVGGISSDITARKRAEEQIQRQLKHLSALRMIDMAISSSFDLRVKLSTILQQVAAQLGVDASVILLYDPQLQTMEYTASRGLRANATEQTKFKLGEGYASRALRARKTVRVSGVLETGGELARALQLANENFVEYFGAPLITKGEVKGVLEVYHRSSLSPNPEWLDFLETLAGQAAIAIDNAQLFDKLQRANAGLEQRVKERTTELNKINLELGHANRTKDEFLATMSHELRTPLNSILGLSETLLEQRRGPLNEHQQKYLETIESSGQHLLVLINDILDLSKIEAGKFDVYPQVIEVPALLRSCLAFIREQALQKSISLHYTEVDAALKVHADPRRLKQILVNLLTNAVKFTASGGEVRLEVETDTQMDRIRFSVVDTGIGIAPPDLKRLFQTFVQVDSALNREYAGTGLGLALVQKLTDLHGGSVAVESEVGKGSRFTINLPWHKDKLEEKQATGGKPSADQPAAESSQPPEKVPAHGVILLAEDNQANILTLSDYLEAHGYQVVVAYDGLEAIARAEEFQPNLILMDIQMPVLDGLEATRQLRANPRFAATPIIALTALAMSGDRELCLAAGANEYLSKPVSLKSLLETIQRLLSQAA